MEQPPSYVAWGSRVLFANYTSPCMALNSLPEHGLKDLVKLYNNSVWFVVRQATLSYINIHPLITASILWSMSKISLLHMMIMKALKTKNSTSSSTSKLRTWGDYNIFLGLRWPNKNPALSSLLFSQLSTCWKKLGCQIVNQSILLRIQMPYLCQIRGTIVRPGNISKTSGKVELSHNDQSSHILCCQCCESIS